MRTKLEMYNSAERRQIARRSRASRGQDAGEAVVPIGRVRGVSHGLCCGIVFLPSRSLPCCMLSLSRSVQRRHRKALLTTALRLLQTNPATE